MIIDEEKKWVIICDGEERLGMSYLTHRLPKMVEKKEKINGK